MVGRNSTFSYFYLWNTNTLQTTLSNKPMRDERQPREYFRNPQKVQDIRSADTRDIVESILKGNYEEVKGLVTNSLYSRLAENNTFKKARRRGGSDMENQLFN